MRKTNFSQNSSLKSYSSAISNLINIKKIIGHFHNSWIIFFCMSTFPSKGISKLQKNRTFKTSCYFKKVHFINYFVESLSIGNFDWLPIFFLILVDNILDLFSYHIISNLNTILAKVSEYLVLVKIVMLILWLNIVSRYRSSR